MYTKNKYRDGVPVPVIADKCRSEDIEAREAAHSTYTHTCKRHDGHVGQHSCICDRAWPMRVNS